MLMVEVHPSAGSVWLTSRTGKMYSTEEAAAKSLAHVLQELLRSTSCCG